MNLNFIDVSGQMLDKKLSDTLRGVHNNLFTTGGVRVEQIWICIIRLRNPYFKTACEHPLLVTLDRQFDLAIVLHHTWTYQAPVHETLDLELNRVMIHEEPRAKMPTRRR